MTRHYQELGSASDWIKWFSTNQKHYPDLGSDVSAVWSFCARCLDVISPGNQSDGVANVGCFLRPWYISLSGSILQLARVAKSDKKNTAFCMKKKYIYIHIGRADFFITNLRKSAVIWVKSRQKPGFLRPISSKITPTKEKERTKSKSEEGERTRREKKQWMHS